MLEGTVRKNDAQPDDAIWNDGRHGERDAGIYRRARVDIRRDRDLLHSSHRRSQKAAIWFGVSAELLLGMDVCRLGRGIGVGAEESGADRNERAARTSSSGSSSSRAVGVLFGLREVLSGWIEILLKLRGRPGHCMNRVDNPTSARFGNR